VTARPNLLLVALIAATGIAAAVVSIANIAATRCETAVGVTGFAVARNLCSFFFHGPNSISLAALLAGGLAAWSVAAFARALARVGRQQRRLAAIRLAAAPAPILQLARQAGIARIGVTDASRCAAYCSGLLRPTVVVTTALVAELDDAELAATLSHEAHHARRREPLKAVVAQLCVATCPWLPILTDILDRYVLARELAADRSALTVNGRAALAGALYAVTVPRGEPTGAVGLADVAAARIDRLFDPDARLPPLLTRPRIVATTAVLLGSAAGLASGAHLHLTLFGWIHAALASATTIA
jgi:Zn-dependent protease with chaperone function